MRVFTGLDELADASGVELGSTGWTTITQERVNLFADATGDHQWIHVDVERARSGPFGGTIAHGFLTLSLLPELIGQLLRVEGIQLAVNYGLNRVRFPAPVPVGSRLRASARLAEVTRLAGAVQAVIATTIEVEGGQKPVCVAESITRFYA